MEDFAQKQKFHMAPLLHMEQTNKQKYIFLIKSSVS